MSDPPVTPQAMIDSGSTSKADRPPSASQACRALSVSSAIPAGSHWSPGLGSGSRMLASPLMEPAPKRPMNAMKSAGNRVPQAASTAGQSMSSSAPCVAGMICSSALIRAFSVMPLP